ncbi:MAG TPA: transporter [Lachnospiraceae bacterium]|nr:transporter [Lachnospiraceae bacterium]
MLKEITLGQYYPGKSILHRLDPRVKLMGTLVFIICLFAFGSTSAYLVAGVTLAIVIALSTVPFSHILRSIRMILILMLVTAVFNLLLTPGDPIVKFGIFRITDQGVKMAIHMTFRLSFLVMGSSIMTLTTTPNQLTGGLEQGLGWMKRIHVPVHEIALMMSIALRFIPILTEEANRIMSAQEARGADFRSGGIIRRAKALIPLLVPLFVSAFRRANDLAMAMEARGYHGGEGRTRMKPLVYTKWDYTAYGLIALFAVIMFLAWRFVRIQSPFLP